MTFISSLHFLSPRFLSCKMEVIREDLFVYICAVKKHLGYPVLMVGQKLPTSHFLLLWNPNYSGNPGVPVYHTESIHHSGTH